MTKQTLQSQALKLGYKTEKAMFADLYVKKFFSQRDLADKLNTTRNIIRSRMADLGIPLRPRSFAKRTS